MKPFLLPLLAGLAAGGVSWYCNWSPKLADAGSVLSFAGSIASVAATMLGFMLAALAVIISITNTELLKLLRKSGHYKDLLQTIFVGCMVFLIIALAGFFLLFGVAPGRAFFAVLMALHAAALTALLDIGRKLWLVMNNLHQ